MIKSLRLKRNGDFDKVFKNGKKVYSKSLLFIYLKEKSLKIGYSVSKKHGKAVVRNRVKRLLRAAMRENVSLIKGSYYIVILPKVSEDYSFSAFKEEIKRVLEREKI